MDDASSLLTNTSAPRPLDPWCPCEDSAVDVQIRWYVDSDAATRVPTRGRGRVSGGDDSGMGRGRRGTGCRFRRRGVEPAETPGEVLMIAVDPEYQTMGIGDAPHCRGARLDEERRFDGRQGGNGMGPWPRTGAAHP